MTSPFAARDALISRAIDRAFGEGFTFVARKVADHDVDLPRAVDASRPPFSVKGVFEEPAKGIYPRARGALQDDNASQFSASMPSLSVADTALPWRPQPGDTVKRDHSGDVYEISRAPRDGMGRTTFFLTGRR